MAFNISEEFVSDQQHFLFGIKRYRVETNEEITSDDVPPNVEDCKLLCLYGSGFGSFQVTYRGGNLQEVAQIKIKNEQAPVNPAGFTIVTVLFFGTRAGGFN